MKIFKPDNHDVFAMPVSYAQERLWFLEQLEPSTAVYNIPIIATMRGSVHRGAFNRAVNRLVSRQEALRTCFLGSAGKPKQVIHAELGVEVDWEDLSRLGEWARSERLQAICSDVASTPFDLTQAPLFRITVVACGHETTIVSVIHHIVADGWSIAVFHRELAALYNEELGGLPASLPQLRIQYADYAVWQREKLVGESLDRLKRYWCRQLEGATTVLELPGDYPRPIKQTFNGAVHSFDLGPDVVAPIRALGVGRDSTLFMTLFSAFAVLLYRLTGQADILVGTPIAGRKSPDVENLIGFFVNTLVLRASMDPGMAFDRLLSEVKTMALEAFEHQDMPFEKLVLELNPKRDLSRSPLTQILFSLQNIPPLEELIGGGMTSDIGGSRALDGHTGTAKFDLALFVSELGEKLHCSIEYNTDLFSAATIEDTSGYFVTLLRAIGRDPGATISSYPLLGEAERRRRLEVSLGAARAGSGGGGCHHLFEAQCRATPDAIAISPASAGAGTRMTYTQLNARANRIARFLTARGLKVGDTAAICMGRGVDQIAVVLAVVKAGAAYVPLDPEYPLERLRFMARDVNARVVICSEETQRRFEGVLDALALGPMAGMIAGQSPEDLDIPYSLEMPLYVIYTSGSTGRPKGVVMPHRAIVNLIEWQARASAARPDVVTLQYAPLNFDVASQEIFSTLTSGGCLQLVEDQVRRDGTRLLHFLQSQGVGRLFLPPVALEQLADAASTADVLLETLAEIIVAGDKLQITEKVRRFFEKRPHIRLTNQYGPTESHVVSAHTLEGPVREWPVHPAIGRPIDNVQLYVLDGLLEPTPPRVSGELYIGGVAVALGYHNLPEESAKRFIPDLFRHGEGLLYRTGDVCRYENDGLLTFLGRADHQIKIRGFRIEPGEVEIILKGHPGVKDAVVVKRPSRQGDDQLVGYLVVEEGVGVGNFELRSFLADKLPIYMIPALFVQLGRFPLTSSGKIDRVRLPDPFDPGLSPPRDSTHVAPRTQVERFLADCWCTLLQIEDVSIRDNFFELGGHSLSATQLVSRIRDEYGLELPLYQVFERPTIELLALEIIQRLASQEEQSELEALLNELDEMAEDDSESLREETGAA